MYIEEIKKFEDFVLEDNNPDESDVSNLSGLLFQSRDVAHIVHLGTSSYAKHKALNEYYDEIVDLVDRFIETYQGEHSNIEIVIPESSSPKDIIIYFNTIKKEIKKIKSNLSDDLSAILDEILELLNSTTYKLNKLK